MKIVYQEHNLDDVLRYFVAGFSNSIEINDYQATVDSTANRVVFKLYVGEAVESHFPTTKPPKNIRETKP